MFRTLTAIIIFSFAFLYCSHSYSQCYEQLKGQGLYLFSPVKTKLTLYKPLPGREWGDSVYDKCRLFGPVYWKRVAPGYIVEPGSAIYAAHSGILRVHTTGANPFGNDACWIDGTELSTAYFHIYPSVTTNQYVYAGQRIGTVIPRSDTTFFYFNIRMAKPMYPTIQRATLPAQGGENCKCYVDPVWPEYFVNPTERYIYWYYNDSDPKTKLSVRITPSWVGKWSFDDGKTWLNSGETVTGLPQKYYKIIFQERLEWKTPLPIEVASTDAKPEFDFPVTYEPEKYIPEIITTRSVPDFVDSSSILAAFDSVRRNAYDSSYTALKEVIYKTFNDSLKSKISHIETAQKKEENKNKILFIVLPLVLLLGLGLIAFYFQYNRLKKQKRYVEELQKELHHRVRNNLGIISGLIDASIVNENTSIPSKDLESRINSIGFVHEQLYQQDDISALNLQDFLKKLCDNLVITYAKDKEVICNVDAPLMIETKLATQVALVISELVTNSLKHYTIPNKTLEVEIKARLTEQRKISITVTDNGEGFPSSFNKSKSNTYGLKMIKGLIKQIRGEINFSNNKGAVTEITF